MNTPSNNKEQIDLLALLKKLFVNRVRIIKFTLAFGLITFLLSAANIIMPLLVFGIHQTIIKYYSSYKNKVEKDGFLIVTLILPLVVIIPLAFIGVFLYRFLDDNYFRFNYFF